MTPSVTDRLASAVRALSYVVLPALPPEASLAREQTQLVIGHLQITLAQYGETPAFERQEAQDFRDLAAEVISLASGGLDTQAATQELRTVLVTSNELAPLAQTNALQRAIDALLVAIKVDGEPDALAAVHKVVLKQAAHRADIDRRWFSLMGFDPEILERMREDA